MPLAGKKILMRVDFNVPLTNGGRTVESSKRIEAAIPTIKYAAEQPDTKVILMSHLGRPDGKKNPEMSLQVCVPILQSLLPGKHIVFADDCMNAQHVIETAPQNSIILLENLRYYAEEERNDADFAKKLASYGDCFVNDAFGTAHRAHASTEGITRYFPGKCAAGDLMQLELRYLAGCVMDPQRPLCAILGGAKVSDKIGVITNLLKKVDKLLIGGGMAFTFLKAQGKEIGHSLLMADKIRFAAKIIQDAGDKLVLPVDCKVTNCLCFKSRTVGETRIVDVDHIPSNWEGVDIGPRTIGLFTDIIKSSKSVIWNGPMGVFEIDSCNDGTKAICEALHFVVEHGGITAVGGGDSESAVKKAGCTVGHVSTGGGASLEFLEGKPMPGVESLSPKP